MTTSFVYKSINEHGNIKEGIFEAENEREVIQFLRTKNLRPLSVDNKKNSKNKSTKKSNIKTNNTTNDKSILSSEIKIFRKKPKTKDIIIFCRQLYTMLNAGMPLISGLEVLIEQSENSILQETIDNITDEVKKGKMLSATMREYPKIFPSLLINMIQAGEMTGNLDDVLFKMSVHYEKEEKINKKIQRAMIYPIVLAVISIVVVIFMLTFVLPTIVSMFTGTGVELPLITRIVLNIS
ncbi:type II secretion system F family protein, partial [Clostridiaceae bacterium HSG29]|nr:type II secretion system F family protein [Clostridiaceae bacterium HSG29]